MRCVNAQKSGGKSKMPKRVPQRQIPLRKPRHQTPTPERTVQDQKEQEPGDPEVMREPDLRERDVTHD